MKLISAGHNNDLFESLVDHSYVGRLNNKEKMMLGDMIEYSKAKKNILLTFKEHNERNVTTINKYIMQEIHIVYLKEVLGRKCNI